MNRLFSRLVENQLSTLYLEEETRDQVTEIFFNLLDYLDPRFVEFCEKRSIPLDSGLEQRIYSLFANLHKRDFFRFLDFLLIRSPQLPILLFIVFVLKTRETLMQNSNWSVKFREILDFEMTRDFEENLKKTEKIFEELPPSLINFRFSKIEYSDEDTNTSLEDFDQTPLEYESRAPKLSSEDCLKYIYLGKSLVFDCRSEIAYRMEHIVNSIN